MQIMSTSFTINTASKRKYQLSEPDLDFWISNNILLQESITKCTRNSKNTPNPPSSCKRISIIRRCKQLPNHRKLCSMINTWKNLTIDVLTSPHHKPSSILNTLPLISLVWLVISRNSNGWRKLQDVFIRWSNTETSEH